MHGGSKRQRASTHHPYLDIALSGHVRVGNSPYIWCIFTDGAAACVPCPCIVMWRQQRATMHQTAETMRKSVLPSDSCKVEALPLSRNQSWGETGRMGALEWPSSPLTYNDSIASFHQWRDTWPRLAILVSWPNLSDASSGHSHPVKMLLHFWPLERGEMMFILMSSCWVWGDLLWKLIQSICLFLIDL